MTTANTTTTAKDIAFGVEVETHLSGYDTTPIGGYHRGLPVAWLPGWKVERDSSIRKPAGRKDAEFVSPVLKGDEGLRNVHEAVTKIRDRGARVNESCGVHVTVTFPTHAAAALVRLIHLTSRYEKGLFASTGTKRRERNHYCQTVAKYGRDKQGKEKAAEVEKKTKENRYHALNLTHLARGRSRIEFRLFSGSTNPNKITAWVRLALALVEYALNTSRAVPFDDNSKENRFGGPGGRTLVHLLSRLGWLEWKAYGYKGKTYGEVGRQEDGLESLEQAAERLRKLAAKYDAQP